MMNSFKTTLKLMEDIHFKEEYDDYEQGLYAQVIAKVAEDHDYSSVCWSLANFMIESKRKQIAEMDKLSYFKDNFPVYKDLLPRKTEAEYMAEDDKSIQNWVDLINQCPGEKKTIDDYNPATEEYLLSQGLNQRYAHYNWDYLYKIAKQRHCSIDHLERLQGLCSFYVTGGNLCKNKSK